MFSIIDDISPISFVRNVLFFGPEKCLNEFKSRVGVVPKRRFWSTLFSFESYDHVSKILVLKKLILVHFRKENEVDQNHLLETTLTHFLGPKNKTLRTE